MAGDVKQALKTQTLQIKSVNQKYKIHDVYLQRQSFHYVYLADKSSVADHTHNETNKNESTFVTYDTVS